MVSYPGNKSDIEDITDEEDKRKKLMELDSDNQKLVTQFGANRIEEVENLPDFYTFRNGLYVTFIPGIRYHLISSLWNLC